MARAMDSLGPRRWVLAGGLLAGTLDISYACVFWGLKRSVSPRRIFQSVASGLLGEAAFHGGLPTAVLGLALHFLIATTMAVVFWLAARRWARLASRPLAAGACYGLLLYLVMNDVVVPVSAARPGSRDPLWVGMSVAVHMLLIGVPIALAARLALQAARPRAPGSA
jgi:hypothetical protein